MEFSPIDNSKPKADKYRMAYLCVRTKQTKNGLKWYVNQVSEVLAGKKKETKLTGPVFSDLGFSLNMTPTQAKDHAKKINELEQVKRAETKSKVNASQNLERFTIIQNSIVPEKFNSLFVEHLKSNTFGSQKNLKKTYIQWGKVQKLLTKLKLQPHEFFSNRNQIYKLIATEKLSYSYMKKLLSVMNAWGEFYAEQSRTFYKRIPHPKGQALEAINDSAKATGQGALPLTEAILNKLSNKLPTGQWEYIHATLWLGLRPSELDNIISNSSKFLKITTQGSIQIIGVYQSKLTGVSKEKRWKYLPCFHSEQTKALQNIQKQVVNKPLVKTLKSYSGLDSIGLYSGRKGFTDLMLSLGQSLEDISQWLGHASIERTWKHYKNKNLVKFNPISEAQNTKEKQAK